MKDIQLLRFDKDISGIVKGFALIFMMILHCYSPGNYDGRVDITYSLFQGIHGSFKICVGLFVFMVGYGYAFSKDKDLRYSLQHIKKLLIPFWVIMFVFIFPVCYREVIDRGLKIFIYNLFGIDSSYNFFSWFVYFYIFAMAVMPGVSRFINKKPLRNAVIAIIAFVLLTILVHELHRIFALLGIAVPEVADNKPLLALFNCCMMSPIMILGYLFAHEGYYERIRIDNIPGIVTFLACIGCVVLAFYLRRHVNFRHNPFQMDFFYVPIVIGSIAVLFNKFKWPYFRKLMLKIGELSVYMWFFHAVFYTYAVKGFYQPFITIFSDINLVVLWTIILTFFVSWGVKTVVDFLIKRLGI